MTTEPNMTPAQQLHATYTQQMLARFPLLSHSGEAVQQAVVKWAQTTHASTVNKACSFHDVIAAALKTLDCRCLEEVKNPDSLLVSINEAIKNRNIKSSSEMVYLSAVRTFLRAVYGDSFAPAPRKRGIKSVPVSKTVKAAAAEITEQMQTALAKNWAFDPKNKDCFAYSNIDAVCDFLDLCIDAKKTKNRQIKSVPSVTQAIIIASIFNKLAETFSGGGLPSLDQHSSSANHLRQIIGHRADARRVQLIKMGFCSNDEVGDLKPSFRAIWAKNDIRALFLHWTASYNKSRTLAVNDSQSLAYVNEVMARFDRKQAQPSRPPLTANGKLGRPTRG